MKALVNIMDKIIFAALFIAALQGAGTGRPLPAVSDRLL